MSYQDKCTARWVAAALMVMGLAMPVAALAAGGARGAINIDPTRLIARLQDQVGFTDDEWSVVAPRILKVVALQAQTGSGGVGGLTNLLGRGRGRGGAAGGQDTNALIDQIFNGGQASLVTTKHNELLTALNDPNTPNQTIEIKMQEYRQAMAMAHDALLRAEAELQAVLTIRQEAMLMSMGILD